MGPELLVERQKVAAQLRIIRGLERQEEPLADAMDGWNRGIKEYVDWLGGVSFFLDYVRRLRENGIVLDIGSGTNKGITEIARSDFGKGLRFIGTNLSRAPGSLADTSPVRIVRTSAERLRGIEDGSVSGVIALASIAYSASPRLTGLSIDRVLVPGGAIKSFFRPLNRENDYSREFEYKTHHDFSAAFKNLGYDVAVRQGRDEDLMVAIKPGGEPQYYNSVEYHIAASLLRSDNSFMDRLLISEGHV